MPGVGEHIVREYFESNGFLIRQLRKYVSNARQKSTDEEIDFVVLNPAPHPEPRKPEFNLSSNDLPSIRNAIILVKGWHTEKFAPSVVDHSLKAIRFLDSKTIKEAQHSLGINSSESLTKILVLPGLPATEESRVQTIELLKAKGIDGVLSFQVMLMDLISGVETNRNYQKSDLLQMLRLLKIYDLLREPQLELFVSKKRRKSSKKDVS